MMKFGKALMGSARGQTMTEYVLIMSAVAVAVFAAYQAVGTTILGLVNTVDSLF
jgi:Flp pilus assembly pilin Flp